MERHQANERYEELYRRLKRAERENQDGKDDNVKMQQVISQLEHEKKSLHDQIRDLIQSHESNIKMMVSKHDAQVSEITSKLENVTEAHASTCRDMQSLLSSQRLMSEKWKDESEGIKDHYEHLIKKLKKEMVEHQERVKELERLIQKSAAQRKELIDQVTVEKRQFAQLFDKHVLLEKQNESLSRQISALLSKEVDMIEEKKRMGKSCIIDIDSQGIGSRCDAGASQKTRGKTSKT
jgi:chromosome segregation ATPase